MAKKDKKEGIKILKANIISALEELGVSPEKKHKYLAQIEKWVEEGNIEQLNNFYKKIQEKIQKYGTKEQRKGRRRVLEGEKVENIPAEFHEISGRTTTGRILKGGEEVSATEKAVEEMFEESEKGGGLKQPKTKSKIISFDARPYIAYYAITNPRYINLYRLRALPLWDWLNENDIRKGMALNFILGTEDEVRNFFSAVEKWQFIRDLDYKIIPGKRLVLRVGNQYASLEDALREVMRKLVKGHYGEEELKRFLRAGVITRILQDADFNWDEIQNKYGDRKITLEIERFGTIERIDTEFSLKDLEAISSGKTFTEHLRTNINMWQPRWGLRVGEFLYAFRDSSTQYDTIEKIIKRDIQIGKALEEDDVYKMPLTGIKKVQAGALHKRYSFTYAIGEDIYRRFPQFYPHYLKMIHLFPNVIWDYISNFEGLYPHLQEALPEAEFFLDFINKRKLSGGQTWIQRYAKKTKQEIDFSQLSFSQKVGETLQENLEELGVKEEQISKIKEGVEKFVSKNESAIKTFYHIDRNTQQIQQKILSGVEAVAKGTMTEEEALQAILPDLKQFAKDYGYEIEYEEVQKYLESLLENREKRAEMREQLEKLMRLYNNGEIDEKTYSERVENILKNNKIDIEETWKQEFKTLKEKFGDKLENLTKTSEGVGFLKRIWQNRIFKRALPIFIIGGGIWGIYTLLRKDKKEEVKPPVAIVEEEVGGKVVATQTEEFRPIYLFPNLWNEYKAARESYKQAVQSYTRGILNFILMSSIFANEIPDIPASDLIRLKVLAEWEGKDFTKLAQGYVVAKRRGITPKTLEELEYYAGVEEPERLKLEKIASMLEKIYNMNVKMNERLLMQAYDRYKMFMRANIDIIKSQFREWQKRQTLIEKAKLSQQAIAKELGLLLAIEAYKKEKEKEGEKIAEAGR